MTPLDRRGREGLAGHGAVQAVGQTRAVENEGEKLRVQVAVFEQQDLQGRLRPACRTVLQVFDGQPPRCGGGSFRTAQNTPRSWMASKNSLKPTGFTTNALTPSS